MIPYAIMQCCLYADGKPEDVRILELSTDGFTFRLAKSRKPNREKRISLKFYQFFHNRYQEVTLKQYEIEKQEKEKFYNVFRLTTEAEDYEACAKKLMEEYTWYVHLKLECSDAELSEEMTGYPAEAEERYPESFFVQKEKWLSKKEWPVGKRKWEKKAIAVNLDHPGLYRKYRELGMEEFYRWYIEQNHLQTHPLAGCRSQMLYVGNHFCPQLFPSEEELCALIYQAKEEHTKLCFVFSFMEDHRIDQTTKLLKLIAENYEQAELVINDWGMVSLARQVKKDCFSFALGILLNKQRKDVRIKYKNGGKDIMDQGIYGQTPLEDEEYAAFLHDRMGIRRVSIESCGYETEISRFDVDLYLPFYQMNTTSQCLMYAKYKNGGRKKQQTVIACPRYCAEHTFLYPESLPMVGRYNSLFGYDEKEIAGELEQKCDRIILNFLS